MANWVKLSDVQYNLMVSPDIYVGQLCFHDGRWELHVPHLRRTGMFQVARDQPEQAMLIAAEWVLQVLTEEIQWMAETSEYLKEFMNRLPVFNGPVPN